MHQTRHLLTVFLLMFLAGSATSQCAYNCTNYIVSPIAYSLHPAEGNTLYLSDDDVSTPIALNFNFDFYCNTYNQVRIGSNGFITFDFTNFNTSLTPYAQHLPDTSSPNAVIAWNWNDLDPSVNTGSGTITYTTIGVAPNQKFVVTYSAVPLWTNSPVPSSLLNTGQIVLHETTNIIEIHIKEANNNGWLNHSEGIEDHTGTNGASVFLPPNSWRNLTLWQAGNSSHMFSPYQVTNSVSVAGTASLCEGSAGTYTAMASPPPLNYNWILPAGWSGSSNGSTLQAIAGSAGAVSVTASYSCGASTAATLGVNVNAAPQLSFSPLSSTVACSGQEFTLYPSGAAGYTLQPFNVSGSSTLVHTVVATVYTLSGTNAQGCISLLSPTFAFQVKQSPTVAVNSGYICDGESFTMTPSGAVNYTFSNYFSIVSPSAGIYSYSVAGTGTNGCVSKPAISNLTVYALPQVLVQATRSIICRGELITFTASGANSYVWAHDSSVAVQVVVSPTMMTTYTLTGTDAQGCASSGKYTLFVSSCVGLEELSPVSHLSVFPNPSDGLFRARLPEDALVQVREMSGKVLYARVCKAGALLLDLSEFRPGMYQLVVNGRESRYHTLVIRQ